MYKCGVVYRQPIPCNLKEENQYGSGVKNTWTSIMNMGRSSINKNMQNDRSLSQQELKPSEGYIIKQKRKQQKH